MRTTEDLLDYGIAIRQECAAQQAQAIVAELQSLISTIRAEAAAAKQAAAASLSERGQSVQDGRHLGLCNAETVVLKRLWAIADGKPLVPSVPSVPDRRPKPDKHVVVPPFDLLSEGCDPSILRTPLPKPEIMTLHHRDTETQRGKTPSSPSVPSVQSVARIPAPPSTPAASPENETAACS